MGEWTDELFDELAQQGDPVADDVVAAHAATVPDAAPRDLVSDLAHHLVLPPEKRSAPIHDYLETVDPLPAWVDHTMLHRSQDFFDENGLIIGTALFCAALPEAYSGARGARVLTLSARMVSDPVRRIYETAQMVVDAMQAHGLTPPDGPGYQDIRRVRLMHAAIRYLVLNDPDVPKTQEPAPFPAWNLASGLPINQEDMLGTLMTFTVTIFESLQKLGVDFNDADGEAYVHAWSVVGHLIGVRPDLLPLDRWDAAEITVAIRRRQTAPSDDAKILGGALVRAMSDSMPLPLRGLPSALLRYYSGPAVAQINGVSASNAWAWLFTTAAWSMRHLGLIAPRDVMTRFAARELGAGVLGTFVHAGRTGDRPPFELPDQLHQEVHDARKRWSL